MSDAPTETRKYIIGWITFPPGNRDRFMALTHAYAQNCRAEPGCLFFEMNSSMTDPDVVTVAECFTNEAAHAAHLAAENFQTFWPILGTLARSALIENIYAGRVAVDSITFPPDQTGTSAQ